MVGWVSGLSKLNELIKLSELSRLQSSQRFNLINSLPIQVRKNSLATKPFSPYICIDLVSPPQVENEKGNPV
jgi:hypothetical protein